METTRHFCGTVYVVCEGAVALHDHEKLGMWLPAGGHVDRDELPHEAALRETEEETGLEVTLHAEDGGIDTDTVRSVPEPRHVLLEDINVHPDGEVGHQHIDFIFFATADSREIDPEPGETPAEKWEWFDAERLEAERDRLEPDVVELGLQAIEELG